MSLPWSILEFSKFACGQGPNGKLCMLVAYFDESGTHGEESEVTTVAGLLGDSLEWSWLEQPWKKVMGGRSFHASACESEEEFNDLSLRLAEVVANSRLVTVGGCVYRDDWNYGASDRMKFAYPSRYHFCLAMVILQVSILSRNHADNDPVAFIFAEQDQYKDYATNIAGVFQQSKQWSNVGYFGFAKPKCLIPLQAADLYSNENYRELRFQLDNPGATKPGREAMRTIARNLHSENRIGTIEFLHRYSDAMDAMPETFFLKMRAESEESTQLRD